MCISFLLIFSALVNCEYYVTSESEYKDFFAFDELAKRNENNTLQIHFFTLSSDIIKFMLSEKNNSLESSTFVDSEHRFRRSYLGDYSETTTRYIPTTPSPTTTTTERIHGKPTHTNAYWGECYEFGKI